MFHFNDKDWNIDEEVYWYDSDDGICNGNYKIKDYDEESGIVTLCFEDDGSIVEVLENEIEKINVNEENDCEFVKIG